MNKFNRWMGTVFLVIASTAGAEEKILAEKPAVLEKGKAAFQTNCVACHGDKGDGNGPAGAMMNPKPRNFADGAFKNGSGPQQVFNTITNGLEGTAMAPFKHLTLEERSGLAYYVLKFKKK